MADPPENGRKPAEGLLRLTDEEAVQIGQQLIWLFRFSRERQVRVRLDILVRRGRVFTNIRLPWGALPPDDDVRQADIRSDIEQIDVRLSSLFGWTEQTRSQAELLIWIADGQIDSFEMSLGQELSPK